MKKLFPKILILVVAVTRGHGRGLSDKEHQSVAKRIRYNKAIATQEAETAYENPKRRNIGGN